jgi:ferredoxin
MVGYFATFFLAPRLGNRNYCRFLCPYGATFGLLNRVGLFRIDCDRETCTDGGLCDRVCDMGIPVLAIGRRHGRIKTNECMGCGRCITECPANILSFVDARNRIHPAAFHRPDTEGMERTFTGEECADCHLHGGDHRIGRRIARSGDHAASDPARERMAAVCGDGHSPCSVTTLFIAGERMIEIGRTKAREAATVVAAVYRDYGDREVRELAELYRLLPTMTDTHLRNLYHGVAHQSPDYQWWYGQPALDGDRLRIKAAATRIARRAALAGSDRP